MFDSISALDFGDVEVMPINEQQGLEYKEQLAPQRKRITIAKYCMQAMQLDEEDEEDEDDSPHPHTTTGGSSGLSAETPLANGVASGPRRELDNPDLLRLCNQTWADMESVYTSRGLDYGYVRIMLNMGLTHACQMKDQLKLTSKLEQKNYELKLQARKPKRIEAELQQETSEIEAVKEEELSKARLEGENIAEMTSERMLNSAKERGRVLGVAAMEMR